MTFSLRSYQTAIIDETRAHMAAGVKSILIESPTGSGKTAIAAWMLGTAQAKHKRCAGLVHRRELVRQTADTFEKINIPYKVLAADFKIPPRSFLYREDSLISVGAVQTVVRRLKTLEPFDFIFWDEAHHCTAGMWKKIRQANPDAFHVGFTATPWRLDGSGLREYFDVIVHGPTPRWLIANGFLSHYEMYGPPGVNLKGIRTEMGDYDKVQLERAVDRPTITGDIIQYYWRYARGKRALGFAVSIQHSKHLVQQFNMKGIPAAHVDGETATDIRDGIFEDLALGKLKVVFNVGLVGEGYDCPAVECIIDACPTQSLTSYLQRMGRGLRVFPGKEKAILLDHAGNWAQHGLPDCDKYGRDRVWTLDGRDNKSGEDVPKTGYLMRECPGCRRVQHTFGLKCAYCGTLFVVNAREVDFVDGELVPVGASEVVTFDGPENVSAIPRGPRKVDTMTEDELIQYFTEKKYPRPRVVARSIVNQRKLHEMLTVGAA